MKKILTAGVLALFGVVLAAGCELTVSGKASIKPGYSETCSGKAVDISSDAYNCGGCGQVCPGGTLCYSGQCVEASSCPGGGNICNGNECPDFSSSYDHCGTCNNPCGVGEYCSGGHCYAESTGGGGGGGGTCGANFTGLSGSCNSCMESYCCSSATACENSGPDCPDFIECIASCNDSDCEDACLGRYPNAAAGQGGQTLSCMQSSCASSCGLQGGGGGGGGGGGSCQLSGTISGADTCACIEAECCLEANAFLAVANSCAGGTGCAEFTAYASCYATRCKAVGASGCY